MKTITIDGVEYNLVPKEKTEQYPIFKRDSKGNVYKIINSLSHEIVFHEKQILICQVLETKGHWNDFETISYDKERGLYHLQPVFVFYGNDCSIEFFNLIANYGNRTVEAITAEQLNTMPFVWSMYQEVLKEK